MATWLFHRTQGQKLFQTAAEVETALADGWVDTPAAFKDKPAEEGDQLGDLRAQAESLGIKVDARWGAKRIQKEIDAKA